MKIVVYGASGMVGSRVAAEAVERGHQVTGVTRSSTDLPAGVRAVSADAGDPAQAKALAADADVVVSAIGPSRTGDDHQRYLDALRNLVDVAQGTRLLVVGGAGSLLVDGQRLIDSPDFPEIYRSEALTQAAALDYFRGADDSADWTYLSPPPVIEPGLRTGSYTLGLDSPVGQAISAEDFAIAVLDELEQPRHPPATLHRRRYQRVNSARVVRPIGRIVPGSFRCSSRSIPWSGHRPGGKTFWCPRNENSSRGRRSPWRRWNRKRSTNRRFWSRSVDSRS